MTTIDPKRIFVLDDEPDMTILTEHMLKLRGFTVFVSNDSTRGLEQLLSKDVDGIVIDLMMPGLDGFAVINKLRESARHAKTPIVVLSAKRLNDSERKSMLNHRVHFVSKPITPTRLIQVVSESVL